MKLVLATLSTIALAAGLAACGSSKEPSASPSEAMTADVAAYPGNPFGKIEGTMADAMKAAVGTGAGDTWVRKMIEHHKGAVEMSKLALTQNPGERVAKMARDTIDKQTKEIGTLQRLVASGQPNPASGDLYRDAEMKMHDEMIEAKGAEFSQTFLNKMLAHHRGAIALSDIALANGVSGRVRQQVMTTRSAQAEEVSMVEAMLAGAPDSKPARETAAAVPVAPAPKMVATPKAATTPSARPSASRSMPPKPAATKASPSPSPTTDPHAGHDMSNMKM